MPKSVDLADSFTSGLDVDEESLHGPEGVVNCQVEVQLPEISQDVW